MSSAINIIDCSCWYFIEDFLFAHGEGYVVLFYVCGVDSRPKYLFMHDSYFATFLFMWLYFNSEALILVRNIYLLLIVDIGYVTEYV